MTDNPGKTGCKGVKPHGMPPILKELMAELDLPQPERTRPFYLFPALARYSGKGNLNLASSFARGGAAACLPGRTNKILTMYFSIFSTSHFQSG
ncbi:hypothetical protein WH50_03550 [Pokkaliibacter plantistimulans]|uniref:Uncharacterized protein n=1 Tax=Pokkaliibacter plantistimulans TaxID=1635171 RepID=A0ABX5M4T8_9GAMM|nr:hypothetical protein WH50_03550 [Pokkaliibacter plantistimulans]